MYNLYRISLLDFGSCTLKFLSQHHQWINCKTLTSPVSLIKCLMSIKEYAFATSPYPVITTLEDHLTPELQAKVAEVSHHLFLLSIFLFDVVFSIWWPQTFSHVDAFAQQSRPFPSFEMKNGSQMDHVFKRNTGRLYGPCLAQLEKWPNYIPHLYNSQLLMNLILTY